MAKATICPVCQKPIARPNGATGDSVQRVNIGGTMIAVHGACATVQRVLAALIDAQREAKAWHDLFLDEVHDLYEGTS